MYIHGPILRENEVTPSGKLFKHLLGPFQALPGPIKIKIINAKSLYRQPPHLTQSIVWGTMVDPSCALAFAQMAPLA